MTKEIPVVNWLDAKIGGKVVQIYLDDKPYLRFRAFDTENSRHAAILKDFLDELDIEYQTVIGRGSGESIPASAGERYKAWFGHFVATYNIIDGYTVHFAKFPDKKADYDIGINHEHLDDIVRLNPKDFRSE